MNRLQHYSFISALLSLCYFCTPSLANNNVQDYIQLVSYDNQFASTPRKEVAFQLINGSLSHQDTHITVNQEGLYFILISAQVGADPKVAATSSGYLDLWIEKNNQPLGFTTARTTIGPNQISTVTTQAIVLLKKGDSISIKFSSDNPKLGFVSIPNPVNAPPISSIDLSMYKV